MRRRRKQSSEFESKRKMKVSKRKDGSHRRERPDPYLQGHDGRYMFDQTRYREDHITCRTCLSRDAVNLDKQKLNETEKRYIMTRGTNSERQQ